MKAYYLHGAKDPRAQQDEAPSLDPNQVLVKVRSCGIRGPNLSYYAHGRNGDFAPRRPFIAAIGL